MIAELRKLNAAVILLQEVSAAESVLGFLRSNLSGYHASYSRRKNKTEGLLCLSKTKPKKVSNLYLAQDRLAQKLTFEISGQTVNIVNVHLYFGAFRDKPRTVQAKQLLEFASFPAIVAGDFNAPLRSVSMKLLLGRFKNTFTPPNKLFWTSPTPLWRGRGARHRLRRGALRAARAVVRGPLAGIHGPIDHILVDNTFQVVRCCVVFDQPSPADPNLYASDHVGLVADLQLGKTTSQKS